MAAAVGGIIGNLLSSTNQAGQKETTSMGQTSQSSSISNANNNTPDIKTAEVKDAAKPMPQSETSQEAEKPKAPESETKDWSKLASMAQNLMSSGGQSQNMNFNATSQAQPLATFR
jgi:hypothetical protein